MDLKHNLLSNIEEITSLASIPFLKAIWLRGNLFSYMKEYRKKAFVLLNSETLILDEKPPGDAELTAIKENRDKTSATIKVYF